MAKFNIVWIPRVISLVFTAFIFLFSLDSLSSPQPVLAFLIHNIPTMILAILTFISWNKQILGSLLFLGFSIFIYFYLSPYPSPIIIVPPLLTSVLFFLSR